MAEEKKILRGLLQYGSSSRGGKGGEHRGNVSQIVHRRDGESGIEFVTGRGGAGFHSPGPTLTTGRGGHFGGDPCPAPFRGESPLIPWTGPRFSPRVLTGTPLGNRRGQGRGSEP